MSIRWNWMMCLLLLGLSLDVNAGSSASRLWRQVTPAAGVEIRSATDFRVNARSGAGVQSVDIYQRNVDGTATKLDTLSASAAGNAGGTYHTSNMAAVFWQLTSLPAGNPAAPSVTVIFINDRPAVPLTSLYPDGPPRLPFAASDATLLLDLDLRTGAPAGWQTSGSGTFDATRGYRPGTGEASGISINALPTLSRAGQMRTGTLAMRLQRTGLSTDNSFGKHFWDSTGNTQNATTQNRQALFMRSNTGNWTLGVLVNAASIPYFLVRVQTNSMADAQYPYWQTLNSHATPQLQDADFADLALTWFQNQYYVYVDGHLIFAGSLGDVPVYTMFQNICIGNFNPGGGPSGAPFGNYYIQRLQISSRFMGPVLAGPTLGLLPDSFAAGYTQRNTPTPTGGAGTYQVADVDAVQNALGLYDGMPARTLQPGQTSSFHEIQALLFQKYGFFPPIYNAGHPGHGYSQMLAPMDDAYVAALNRAQPAIIMAGGTINDISAFSPAHGTLVADTKTMMSRLAAGGGSRIVAPANPQLEQIVYLETLSSQGIPTSPSFPSPAYATESQAVIAATRAGLPGFKPANGVGFSYVSSREWWDQSADYATYLYGTNSANPNAAPGHDDYDNGHPDATGFSVIAAHLYTPIANAVVQAPIADLSVRASGTQTAAGLSTFSVTVSNAGPRLAGHTVLTATLPAGANLVVSSSTTGCAQSGRVLSCAVGTVLPGSSMALTVSVQASPPVPVVLAFSSSSPDSYDSVPGNDAVSITAAPPVAPATDGPLPPWVLMALGLAFLAAMRLREARR